LRYRRTFSQLLDCSFIIPLIVIFVYLKHLGYRAMPPVFLL